MLPGHRGGMKHTSHMLRSGILAALISHPLAGQSAARPPVIDVHFHGMSAAAPAALSRPDSLNVRYRMIPILPVWIDGWQSVDREVDGESLPDVEPVTLVRKPAAELTKAESK